MKRIFTLKTLVVYLLISVCLIGSLLFIAPVVTYAETEAEIASNEQIYKELTDSDELPGQNITLDGYINNLKTGYYEDGTTQKYEENTKHLSSIIPIDLFASANETYYWGKEYFFYICTYHSNTRLTSKVVLVDYDFEYNELKKSADVLIKTITKNFFYIENGGKPMLKPAAEKEVVDVDKAVLFNPVLFGIINNKHALNDYDAGYSKKDDKGIIFRHARMNFSGAYRESNFSWEPIEKLIFDKAFGAALKFLHLDFISDVKDIIYAIADGIEGAEKEVEANNEAEITDYYTKDAQIADESIKSLSKAIWVSPKEKVTFINDYIQLKVLLSEDIAPTLLSMGAFFDVRVKNPITNEYKTLSCGNGNNAVVFSQSIHEKVYEYDSAKNSLYVLPGEKQVVKFTAPFHTKYRFLHNFSDVKVFSSYDTDKLQGYGIVNAENSIYELNNNNTYYAEIYNDSANPMSGYIEIDVIAEEIISENKVIVKPLINTFCKIEGESRIVTLNIVGDNVNIEFYDDEFNLIDFNKYETEYNFIKNDGVSYILFKTDSPQDVTAVVSVVNDSPVTVDEDFSINGLQSKYYLFVPYVTADYLFKTNINNVDVRIVNFENGSTNRLIEGEKYFLFVKNENLKTAMFSVEFDVLNVDIGRNNLYEKSIGVYKFIPPQNMKYTICSQIPIDCVCINGVKTAINALEFSNYYEKNTEIYIIINNVKATTTIEIKAFYDEELTVGKGTDIETTGNDGLVVKFSAQKNSYYVITATNDFCLYSQNLSFIEYNDSVYLSTGIYYLDFAVQTGEQVSVKVEAVSQIINPHEQYTFNYTSYLFVILKQNTEYIFETLGDIDKNISTAIEIYDKSGINLLTSAKFTKFGKIDFSTGNNTEFNIIVRANTKSNFVFRIVYAMGSVGENKVSLSVGGYTTVASGSYLEIAAQKQVELYFSIPNDLASIELYNVNGYEKLTPSVTYSSYKKYVFLDKGNVKLYVNADNAKYLSVVLLPENVNNELIVKDATNEIVNEFLFGNSYSFEWNNNGNIISNSISSLIFTVNGTVSQPFDVMFNTEDIETNIEISFILFDRSIIKTFTVVGSAYELNLDFALATDVQKNSTVDEKSTLHLTIKADLIDNGSDGTTEIIKKTVNLIQNGEVVCNWDFVEDKLIDLSEYAWSDLLKFSYEITFSDGGIYKSESLLQNDSFLLNENIDISSDMKVLNLKGGTITDINKVITVPSNILMVNIKGYKSREYDKITFFIAERNQPVLFNIENFYCYSYYEKMIGYACFYSNNNNENDAYIVMKMKGNNTFYASQEYLNKSAFSFNNYSLYIIGESDATLHVSGADGIETKIGQYGFGGSCAIFVDDLYIQGFERVSLYGGCGSDGGFGKNGEDATDYTTTGGSGEDGKNGGNGLSAIVCDNLTIINTKNFSAFGGDGGRGGKGGNGGNGAVGRSNPNKDGGAGGNGSNGGYGGTGGCGGNGADAVVVRFSASINVSGSKSFLGGNAGAAGKGGKGGKGGDGGTGATGTSGIAGGAGGKGGNGGNGGDGGNGGVVGKAGYGLCVNGERSETKGLTYDSPDYLYEASGIGGAGGNGGKGGSGGSGWFGTTGSAGASGKAGTIGDSGEPGKK